MNRLLIEQLKEIAGQIDWTMVHIKDEDSNTVMVCIGAEEWVDEFFGDMQSD